MRTSIGIGLLCLTLAGCHGGLKVNATMSAHDPIPAEMKSNMICTDEGPLCETVVAPGDCCPFDAKVAIIDVDGLLVNLNPVGQYSNGENPVGIFKEKLTAAAMDRTVRGVILRINTPGGTVGATDLMYHELMEFRAHTHKPVVACILDVAAGGGYYLASGCDRIVAIPTATVGGIGVIYNSYYLEDAMAKQSAFPAIITAKASKRIDMGSVIRKNDDDKDLLEDMANQYLESFKQSVQRTRPVANDSPVFDGRVMTANQAVEAGLVDSLGHLHDALEIITGMTSASAPRTVMYCRKTYPARTAYAINLNRPLTTSLMSGGLPGLTDRSQANLFLYLWQADPAILKMLAGK